MLVGFYVLKGDGTAVYSPSFDRVGLAAVFTAVVMQLIGSPTSLTIRVEHKNREDTLFGLASTFPAISAVNPYSLDVSGLKEEVRFAFQVSATAAWEGFYLLMSPPSWRPY